MKNVVLTQMVCKSVPGVKEAINFKMENVKVKVCVLKYSLQHFHFYPPPSLSPTATPGASSSSCDTGCIIGIVLAILGAIILSVVVALVVYAVYRYLSNPATKLAKTGTEGLNG